MQAGWGYWVAVLDWHSRYVVSWELDQMLEMPFGLDTVERVLAQATRPIQSNIECIPKQVVKRTCSTKESA
jgi:hypothetical protein